ncbi:bifunctional DNA-formamidopyrimidine glycosylase/DNA-(apurinic or apyrimidinic site) lyase [Pelagibacteraceae bacterium]|nr:bifunctional DNA-formamidopyrimidine glycosylase/DNA-(apurinic or apyrimidinic site) lyase [Pelagibacteraceae bacterium]
MPELPEVEVVKRSLTNFICNLSIKNVEIRESNLRYKVKKEEINQIIGLKIVKIKRRSKYLLFFFTKGLVMIAHLGMTGKFFIINKKLIKKKTSFYYNIESLKDNKHNHIIFTFKDKTKLIYNDIRKFGFFKFDTFQKLRENKHLKFLGPEPLENIFNYKYFKNYIQGKKRYIKDLLMDQKFVSGLGNIYVNEVLFYSEVRPTRKINRLKDQEIMKILKNIKKILKKAISLGGSSIKNFSSSTGKDGSFQQHFGVYGKKGEDCSNADCRKKIKKIILSNRASFFCLNCQK